MSEKEIAMQLLNNLPEYKLGYVIAYLQGLLIDEVIKDCRNAQNIGSERE